MNAKISFGFKSVPKKSPVILNSKPEEKKVELIECFVQQNIKIKGEVETNKDHLVIPMIGKNKTLLDRVKDATDLKERSLRQLKTKAEKDVDNRPDSELTLDELAARRLIEEATTDQKHTSNVKVTRIPAIEENLILEGAKEPTLNDYEQVPINDFGYALLRGMGWSENTVAGKKKVEAPELRAKGMGLGADKMIKKETPNKLATDKDGKELKFVKGGKAKIIAGKEKGNYCTIEGFDDDSCRIIVKTALGGTILSLNEFLLIPVSREEFSKSSRILNNSKYQEYIEKNKERNEMKDEYKYETKNNFKNGKIDLSHSKHKFDTCNVGSSSHSEQRSGDKHDHKIHYISSSSSNSRSRSRSKERNTRKKRKHSRDHNKKHNSNSDSTDDNATGSRKKSKKSKNKDDRVSKSRKKKHRKQKKSKSGRKSCDSDYS